MHSNLPPEIKIGAFNYRILREPEVPNLGITRHAEMEIAIAENLALPLACLILWRQIDGIIRTYWTDTAFVNGLMTVWRDNKEFMSWTSHVLEHSVQS